jgi:predicted metal-dependent phosphoesterase TrpH
MNIDWQDVITTVGVTTLSGGVLLGAAAWLIRTVLTHKLTRDADAFRIQLKADADMEIERLKNSLQMVAAEHQVRFSKLHEKRAEVIAELYKRLEDVHWHGRMFVLTSENNPTPAQQEEFDKTAQQVFDLTLFVEQHRIYLPESVCVLLDKFVGDVRGNVYAAGIFGRIKYPNDQTLRQSQDAFTKAYEEFEKDIPEARRAVEIAFRKILGGE